MKLLFFSHISTAMQSLRINRVRSFLTMIGVAIGIASITAILALAAGVSEVMDRQVSAVGDGVAIVTPGVEQPVTAASLLSSGQSKKFSISNLTETDIDALRKVDGDVFVAPLMLSEAAATVSKTDTQVVSVLATTPDFIKTAKIETQEDGQFIDNKTDKNTAVLGEALALKLFGEANPIGKVASIKGQQFTVIGTLKKQRDPINYNNVDLNRSFIVSLEAGKALNRGYVQIQQINVRAKSKEALEAVLPRIEKALLDQHKEKDFTVTAGKDIATPTNNTYQSMAGVMVAIAAISLLVGGIGIMNIMLVNVAERTREIGIRKAVGASSGSIALQFLIESSIVSLVGGIVGYAIGAVCALAIGMTLSFSPLFTLDTVLIAVGIAIGIGIVFGLYPALRAARKDPIESLRQYR